MIFPPLKIDTVGIKTPVVIDVFFPECMILLYVGLIQSCYLFIYFKYFNHFTAVARAPPSGQHAASQTEPRPPGQLP